MTPERWAEVKDLFAEALGVDSAERTSWLAGRTVDSEVLDEVRSLLAAHENAGEDSVPIAPPRPPTVIAGRYELGDLIGAGGMGRVYKARDNRLGRDVALKIIAVGLADRGEYVRRFDREVRALSSLEHPNICRVYDAGVDGHPYLVMELLQGETLRQCLERGQVSLETALHIAISTCRALSAAAYAGFIHRDIKPGNLFLTTDGITKVVDFGLVKKVRNPAAESATRTQLTSPGQAPGTPSYMSPEQLCARDLDARTDVFSLGVVLYEMLTGACPFQGGEPAEVAASILKDSPAAPSSANPRVPRALDRIVLRALEKDPVDRYSSAADMAADLRKQLPETTLTVTQPAIPRRRELIWAGAGALALGAAALVYVRGRDGISDGAARQPQRLYPFTGYTGRKAAPAFAPAGDRLAFSWTGEQNTSHDIYLRMVGGGQPLRLTDSPDPEQNPMWSRKGDSLAYRRSGPQAGYYIVPPLGGASRKIADSLNPPVTVSAGNFDWTPDGAALLIADSEKPDAPLSLFLVNIVDGAHRPFYSGPPFVSSPVFSPDGKWLAYTEGPSYLAHDLFVMPASGPLAGKPRRLTQDGRWISGLCWTASGRELIFSSTRKGLFSLWRVSASGGHAPEAVAGTGMDAYSPAVSSDGRRLAFVQRKNIVNVWRRDLRAAGAAAAAEQVLLPSTRTSVEAVYSPDGARIAFTSDRTGTSEVWVSEADGSGARQVTAGSGSQTGSPSWSPDGSMIVYDSRPDGVAALFVVSAGGAAAPPRRLTLGAHDAFLPSWSHDGARIYFLSTRGGGGRAEVWSVAASGEGAATRIGGHDAQGVCASPNGAWIYYADRGGLWRRPTSGDGAETRVIEQVYWRDFAVTRQGIYFAPAVEKGNVQRVLFLDNKGRTPVEVARIGPRAPRMGALSASSDGRYLLYERLDQVENDIYMVENFDGARY